MSVWRLNSCQLQRKVHKHVNTYSVNFKSKIYIRDRKCLKNVSYLFFLSALTAKATISYPAYHTLSYAWFSIWQLHIFGKRNRIRTIKRNCMIRRTSCSVCYETKKKKKKTFQMSLWIWGIRDDTHSDCFFFFFFFFFSVDDNTPVYTQSLLKHLTL